MAAAWSALLGEAGSGLATRLSGQFDLSMPAIQDVVERLATGDSALPASLERMERDPFVGRLARILGSGRGGGG